MSIMIGRLADVASAFDAVVFDQFGVLHNGHEPGAGVIPALRSLRDSGATLAVLTNSGKRAKENQLRLASLGFPDGLFDVIMSSGEALWRDLAGQRCVPGVLFAITAKAGDAQAWAADLPLQWADRVDQADAILLMGLGEGRDGDEERAMLRHALALGLPIYCTNPDLASPRPNGLLQTSPGLLAHEYAQAGGTVHWYGKPHRTIFDLLAATLRAEPSRLLMVGDSMMHDIAGAATAGWKSAFVCSGIAAARFGASQDATKTVLELAREAGCPPPDYCLERPR